MTGIEPAATRTWRTRANLLTIARLALAPVLVAAVLRGAPELALAAFVLAVASDLLDGRVARRFGESTAFGGFLDHATDAIFVASGLAALAVRGEVPLLLPILVLAAFVQYALDSRALAGRRLRASVLGRANGIAYFVVLAVPIVRDALGLSWPSSGWANGLGWVLVLSSLVSMADRALALRRERA